jgi:heterodisulfide reductase subunit C
MADFPKPTEMFDSINYALPEKRWEDVPPDLTLGNFCYPTKRKNLEYLGLPANKDEWSPTDEDWNLPDNWQTIIHEGFKDLLGKYRSLKIFMDTCVRCGACADKCHFFIGTGDPKNMPVLRAELLRSVYRNDFTMAGKILGSIAGARKLTKDVIKEWFSYFYQCSECRRCSLYCPYGIDTAEITMMGRELLTLLGLNINWILEPAANCFRTGNHLGIQPHAFKEMIEFFCDDIEEITGVRINPSFNRKGAEILFVTPSGDAFADPGTYSMMGYLLLFEHIGLDYTPSTRPFSMIKLSTMACFTSRSGVFSTTAFMAM